MVALPAQSAWTFKYFLNGNTSTTPDSVQVYRTRARALGMAELRGRSFPTLSAGTISTFTASSSATSGNLLLETTAPVNFAWTIPAGALSPTSSSLFGSYLTGVTATSRAAFNDSTTYLASARAGVISCSTQNAADTHCSGATGGGFKAGSVATGLNLVATDGLNRLFASQFNAYSLTIAP
jgi:hypothetical protein